MRFTLTSIATFQHLLLSILEVFLWTGTTLKKSKQFATHQDTYNQVLTVGSIYSNLVKLAGKILFFRFGVTIAGSYGSYQQENYFSTESFFTMTIYPQTNIINNN
jgi:uncharacterized membrane protein